MFCLLMLFVAAICRAQAPRVQWHKVIGNETGDYPKKILQTADGGFVVAGFRSGTVVPTGSNTGTSDDVISVAKFNASGEAEWENAVISGAQQMADIVQTHNGEYLVITSAWVQECNVPSQPDVYAIRLNAKGEIIWKKHYGGANTDDGYAVDITPEGDFVIAGSTRSSDLVGYKGGNDWYVIKISANGDLLWEKTLGGSASDYAFSVAVAADGSSLVTGYTDSNDGDVTNRQGPRDAWVIKFSPSGDLQWEKCFGGSMYEMCNSVSLSHTGGFILAVQANSVDGGVTGLHNALGAYSDFWIVEIASNGSVIWSKCYGGLYNEIPYDIQKTQDGGYVVAGSAESANGDASCNNGYEDAWLIKISANGTLQWQKSFGGSLSELAYSVQQLADKSFLLAAPTNSPEIAGYHPVVLNAYTSSGDWLLIKIGAEGAPSLPTSVTIDRTTAAICSGQPASLHASLLNAGILTSFQWTKNGVVVGENSPDYTSSDLKENDLISCTVIPDGSCEIGASVAYDELQISLKPELSQPDIKITASTDVLCECKAVVFRATIANIGVKPSYTWFVNGKRNWSNQDILMVDKMNLGDIVYCEYSDASSCFPGGKITSNSIQYLSGGSASAAITISTASAEVCAGSPVRINAATVNAGINPTYTWTVNGQVVGTNADSIILDAPKNGDRVQCSLKVDAAFTCVSNTDVSSEEIQLTVRPKMTPSVSLSTPSNNLCQGQDLTLTVEGQDLGTMPQYRWMISGQASDQTTGTFRSNRILDKDEIYCIVTPGDDVCGASPMASERIIFNVFEIPKLLVYPADTIVMRNAAVQLHASVTGDYSSLMWTPAALVTDATNLNPMTIPMQESAELKLIVTNENNCTVTAVSKIKVRTALFMPNAFTPNADGRNDIFRIPQGTTINLIEFSVYNRWGNKLFSTNDISKGWTGRDGSGKLLDSGAYIFMVRGSDDKGAVMQKGTVLLIR